MINTTCREVHNLLELFFDSELEPRQMRAVALHSATCPSCEEELRQLERLQDLVSRSVNERVDEVELGQIWSGIEHRLRPRRTPWTQRARDWMSERELGWAWPAFGAMAAAAAAAVIAFSFSQSPTVKSIETALVDNPVSVHEISSDSHVALLGEADTLLLWVDHELAGDATNTAEPVNFEEFE